MGTLVLSTKNGWKVSLSLSNLWTNKPLGYARISLPLICLSYYDDAPGTKGLLNMKLRFSNYKANLNPRRTHVPGTPKLWLALWFQNIKASCFHTKYSIKRHSTILPPSFLLDSPFWGTSCIAPTWRAIPSQLSARAVVFLDQRGLSSRAKKRRGKSN